MARLGIDTVSMTTLVSSRHTSHLIEDLGCSVLEYLFKQVLQMLCPQIIFIVSALMRSQPRQLTCRWNLLNMS